MFSVLKSSYYIRLMQILLNDPSLYNVVLAIASSCVVSTGREVKCVNGTNLTLCCKTEENISYIIGCDFLLSPHRHSTSVFYAAWVFCFNKDFSLIFFGTVVVFPSLLSERVCAQHFHHV